MQITERPFSELTKTEQLRALRGHVDKVIKLHDANDSFPFSLAYSLLRLIEVLERE